jgi:hypothetical protein
MTLHFVLQFVPKLNFLQVVFVVAGPEVAVILQPARTLSSGVPLPRTINCGLIHCFLLPSMSVLDAHNKLAREIFYTKAFLACVNGIVPVPIVDDSYRVSTELCHGQ